MNGDVHVNEVLTEIMGYESMLQGKNWSGC